MRAPEPFRVFRGADGVAELLGATIVAFGKFDGVHRGRRVLLDRALAAGRRMGLPAGAVTFERHPHAHLRGGRLPPVLTGLADRLRLLRDAGAAFVVLLPTDATVLGLTAEDFACDVLRDRMRVRLVVVGENFRFGRGGAGDVGTLRRLVAVTGLDAVGTRDGLGRRRGGVGDRVREHLACGRRRPGRGPARPAVRRRRPIGRHRAVVPHPYISDEGGARVGALPGLDRAVPAGDSRTAAVVAVHPPGQGQQCLEVERPADGVPDGAAGRGVRVMFEGRA